MLLLADALDRLVEHGDALAQVRAHERDLFGQVAEQLGRVRAILGHRVGRDASMRAYTRRSTSTSSTYDRTPPRTPGIVFEPAQPVHHCAGRDDPSLVGDVGIVDQAQRTLQVLRQGESPPARNR